VTDRLTPASQRAATILDRARDALTARMTKDNLLLVLENVINYAAELEAEREKLVRWHGEDSKTINRLVDRIERHRARLTALQNDALSMRGSLAPADGPRAVPFELGETLTPAVDWLINRVAELEAAPVLVCRECAAPVRWVENPNGGWWNHTGPAPDGHGVVPKPAEDPCHPCGCPKRFDRHAWGCPTLAAAEDEPGMRHAIRIDPAEEANR
jgi:hypothetical protein